eukprot:scaffold48161_cov63-Phaeocystis_antarctica.AAC.1
MGRRERRGLGQACEQRCRAVCTPERGTCKSHAIQPQPPQGGSVVSAQRERDSTPPPPTWPMMSSSRLPTSRAMRRNAARSIWRAPGKVVCRSEGCIGTQSSGSRESHMKPRASGTTRWRLPCSCGFESRDHVVALASPDATSFSRRLRGLVLVGRGGGALAVRGEARLCRLGGSAHRLLLVCERGEPPGTISLTAHPYAARAAGRSRPPRACGRRP